MCSKSSWHLQLGEDKLLYLFRNGQRLTCEDVNLPDAAGKEIGGIINVKPHPDEKKSNFVVFKAIGPYKPRTLDVSRFSTVNELCGLFKESNTAQKFCKLFMEKVKPNINQHSGVLDYFKLLPAHKEQALEASTRSVFSSKRMIAPDSLPNSKRKKLSDENHMNEEVEQYHMGLFKLPISCLKEPAQSRLLREIDPVFVKTLKAEMIANPTTDVAPMIGVVYLDEGETFDKAHPESYMYEAVGGNNSRVALSELLAENPELRTQSVYKFRTVSVYVNLSDHEAHFLATKHNRSTNLTHKLTSQDQVALCRKKLYALSQKDLSDEPPEMTTEWRNSCATILMMTRKQLQENMIYPLAGLTNRCYSFLLEIFRQYEVGNMDVPKTKQLKLNAAKLDCKGSNFKGLRNLTEEAIFQMLSKTAKKEIKLKDLNGACKQVKKLDTVKAIFVKQCDVQSWEDAVQKFPIFTTDELLLQFTHKPLSKEAPPPGLLRLCQKAQMSLQGQSGDVSSDDKMPLISKSRNGNEVRAVFVSKEPESLLSEDITGRVPTFHGISLAIIDMEHPTPQVESICRTLKSINILRGEVNTVIAVRCEATELGSMKSLSDKLEYRFDVVYWIRPSLKSSKGNLFKQLVDTWAILASTKEAVKSNEDNIFTANYEEFISNIIKYSCMEGDYILHVNATNEQVAKICLRSGRHLILAGTNVTSVEEAVSQINISTNETDNEC